jgi:ABC-type transport system involved in multi-copper enzyme maturation permease subunit
VNGVVIEETVRRALTSIAYVTYVAFIAIVSLGVSRFNRPGAGWPSLVALLAFIIGCTSIGPEFSSGTLQLILTKPVNRSIYLLSRVAGAVCAVWIATFVAAAVELLGRAVWGADAYVDLIGTALLHSLADTILTCALLAFFGSFTRAYFNIAIYFVLMIGLGISQGILSMMRASRSAVGAWLASHDIADRSVAAISGNLFPDAPLQLDWHWILMVLSNAALALVAACFIFRNREVPYGAD